MCFYQKRVETVHIGRTHHKKSVEQVSSFLATKKTVAKSNPLRNESGVSCNWGLIAGISPGAQCTKYIPREALLQRLRC